MRTIDEEWDQLNASTIAASSGLVSADWLFVHVESVCACDYHCISAKSTKCFVFFFSIIFDQLRSWKLEVLEPALSFREYFKVREKYVLSSVQFIPLSFPHFFELKFVLIPPESNIQLKISDHWYHAILSTCCPCLDTSPMMLMLVLLLLLLLLLMLLLSFWLLMLLLLLWLSMFLSFFFLFSSAIIPSTTSLTLTRNGNYIKTEKLQRKITLLKISNLINDESLD